MTAPADQAKLVELIGDIPIAMLTTYGGAGCRGVPMARQEVEPHAEMWFIAARDTKHVADIQVEPRVSLTFSSRSSWVALTGTAAVVDDEARLKELWNTSGGNIASLISFAKTKLTGDTFDTDHGVVHP